MGNETQQPSALSGGQMRDYQLQVCERGNLPRLQQAVGSQLKRALTMRFPFWCFRTIAGCNMQGLRWMVGLKAHGLNGILADEMGLGKTLMVS